MDAIKVQTNLDSMTHILDCKIKEINEMRNILNEELKEFDKVLLLKNKLIKSNQTQGACLKKLKENYTYIQEIPSIMQNIHLFNLYIIQQIQARYHQQYLKMKFKYETEIKELNAEIQTQYKIRKNMIQEVEELKKCVEQFVKQKQNNSANHTPSKSIPKLTNLEIIHEQEDQIVESKKENVDYQQQIWKNDYKMTNSNTITPIKQIQQPECQKAKPKSFLNILNRILKPNNGKSERKIPKISLQELKRSIQINKSAYQSNQKENKENSKTVILKSFQNIDNQDYQSDKQQHQQNLITPRNLKQTSFCNQNALISNNFISEQNSENKIGKHIQKSYQKQNYSFLDSHSKKKESQKNRRSFLNQKSKSKQKIIPKDQRKTSRELIKVKQQKTNNQLIKNYICLKENQNSLFKNNNNGFFVGDKKIETKYQGSKRDGKKNGSGVIYYSNGLTYEGLFKDNLRSGYGILKFNHIEIYNGQWQNDMIHGKGRIKNCSVINQKKKQSDSILSKWVSYSGEFKQNKFHGNGTLNLQNGQKFLGKFKNGIAQGEGTFYKRNGDVQIVICKNDFFVDKV